MSWKNVNYCVLEKSKYLRISKFYLFYCQHKVKKKKRKKERGEVSSINDTIIKKNDFHELSSNEKVQHNMFNSTLHMFNACPETF